MKWNFLPITGGMADQDPELMEMFDIIFNEQGKAEKERSDKREREMKEKKSSGGVKKPRGRRR
jgi:hypothetical protein